MVKNITTACEKNAENLLNSAKCLAENKQAPNAAFHLALLAIEEIGKASLVKLGYFRDQIGRSDGNSIHKKLDRHEQKIFWGLHFPLFTSTHVSGVERHEMSASSRELHKNRLDSLYVSENGLIHPISEEILIATIKAAESRLDHEKLLDPQAIPEQGYDLLRWFLDITTEENNHSLVFSQESIEYLSHVKGNTFAWIQWLQEQFQLQEKLAYELLSKEVERSFPEGNEGRKSRWEFNFALVSPSHTPKNSELKYWNEQWASTQRLFKFQIDEKNKKKGEYAIKMTFPKNIHMQGLDLYGYQLASCLVISLNIASLGFFWWHPPMFQNYFCDDIRDLETGHLVGINEEDPYLQFEWHKRRLTQDNLANAAVCHSFIMQNLEEGKRFLEAYLRGLALLAKTDKHLPLTVNAGIEFISCLDIATKYWGDRLPDETIHDCLERVLAEPEKGIGYKNFLYSTASFLKGVQEDLSRFTLDAAMSTKVICDFYLWERIKHQMQKTTHEDTIASFETMALSQSR